MNPVLLLRRRNVGGVAPNAWLFLNGFFNSFWKLADENDAIGSNNLTNVNTVTFGAGKIGNAANYVAASSQVLTKAGQTLLANSVSRSIAFWFKPTATGINTQHSFLSTGNIPLETQPIVLFGVSQGGDKLLYAYHGGAYRKGTTVLVAGTWYSVFATFDQATTTLNVYLNGVLEIGPIVAGDVLGFTHYDNLYIGSGFGGYWDGMIDAVGIASNKVASPAQIAAFYNSGLGIEP